MIKNHMPGTSGRRADGGSLGVAAGKHMGLLRHTPGFGGLHG